MGSGVVARRGIGLGCAEYRTWPLAIDSDWRGSDDGVERDKDAPLVHWRLIENHHGGVERDEGVVVGS